MRWKSLAAKKYRGDETVVSRCGRLFAFFADDRRSSDPAFGVFYLLHAVSARDSQGTLQYIFEFQTLICQLTGMDVANASMYDGSTAMAEAYLMAQRVTRRDKIVVATSVHPEYREVARTYTQHGDAEIVEIGFDEETGPDCRSVGTRRQDRRARRTIAEFFGCVED